jgi:hypothetical protein
VKRKLAGIIAVVMSGVFALAAAPPALASGPELCGCGGPALAVGVDAAGTDFVFYAGSDFGLWEKWSSYGQYWSAGSTQGLELLTPQALGEGALVVSTPAVAVHANGVQDVFWQGYGDGHTWESSYANGSWSTPSPPGFGPTASVSAWPAAGADANGNDYVFWTANGALYENWRLNGAWNGGPNGHELLNAAQYDSEIPAQVAVHANGEQDVFWVQQSPENALMEYYYVNGAWHGPVDLGGL